jgi:hypothetical protein
VVQNKLLWAISQQTAAELIYRRVDASLPLMGMQSLDKKSTLAVKKTDISIAKNYLKEDETNMTKSIAFDTQGHDYRLSWSSM